MIKAKIIKWDHVSEDVPTFKKSLMDHITGGHHKFEKYLESMSLPTSKIKINCHYYAADTDLDSLPCHRCNGKIMIDIHQNETLCRYTK